MRCRRRKRLKSSVHCAEESNNGIASAVASECSHFTASGLLFHALLLAAIRSVSII